MLALEDSLSSENQPPASLKPSQNSSGISVKLLNVAVRLGRLRSFPPLKYCLYHFHMEDFEEQQLLPLLGWPPAALQRRGAVTVTVTASWGYMGSCTKAVLAQWLCPVTAASGQLQHKRWHTWSVFSGSIQKYRPITWSKGYTGSSHEFRNSQLKQRGKEDMALERVAQTSACFTFKWVTAPLNVKQAEDCSLHVINTKYSWICSNYSTDREQINPKTYLSTYLLVSSYVRIAYVYLESRMQGNKSNTSFMLRCKQNSSESFTWVAEQVMGAAALHQFFLSVQGRHQPIQLR